MHTLSLKQLADGLRSRQFSSRELTQHFLGRIETLDPQINSFITVTPEAALAQADAADARLAAGNAGPLTGIPLAQTGTVTSREAYFAAQEEPAV